MIEVIFQFLLTYGGKHFSDLVLIAMFGFMLYYTYKAKKENRKTREEIVEDRRRVIPALSEKMRSVVRRSAIVNRELDQMTGDLEADRGWLYVFHNMGYDFVGQPFAKVTNTNESTAPGIDSRLNQMKDVPIGLMSCFIDQMIEKGEVFYPNIEDIKESDRTAYNHLRRLNIKSTYAICLFCPRPEHMPPNGSDRSSKGDIPIGFVGVDYIKGKKELDDEEIKKLKYHAMIIKGILMGKHEQENQRACAVNGNPESYYKVDNY